MSPLAKALIVPHTIASIMWAVFKQTRRCLVADVIKPLANMSPLAKVLLAPHTIASMVWAVFKQSRRYTIGLMVDNAALVPEWIIMVSNLRGAQDFRLLEVPPVDIAGNIDRLELDPSSTKGDSKRSNLEVAKKQPPAKGAKKEIFVHPSIRAKVLQAFPHRLDLKKLCSIYNVKTYGHSQCSRVSVPTDNAQRIKMGTR